MCHVIRVAVMEVDRLRAELLKVDTELASVQNELELLLHKQEELQERKRLIAVQLESIQSIKSQEEERLIQRTDWESGVFPWTEKIHSTLKSLFKLKSFRHLQLSSINATLSDKDSILIMPTGGGKSLCYQLPACIRGGLTLVISPLVSLMQDQLLAVQSLQIESSMLNASTSRDESTCVHRAVAAKSSTLKLLYVTPERISKSKRIMSSLEKSYKLGQLSLIVIDEVHCVSQWGHDFRPDYKKLGVLKTQFPSCPILGLTATATSKVLADVQEMLSLKQCLIFRASYNRSNLFYEVRAKPTSHKAQVEEMAQLIKTKYPKDCGIVYCFSRKDCEEVTFDLARSGVVAGCYHADLTSKERTRVHTSWLKGSTKVIVATIAFGMGIDKPNVRFVIHHSISKSMENYYQESGRAGRDGEVANCVLFFRAADVFRQSSMVFTEHTGLQNLHTMVKYCLNETACRRSIIAQSFGEKWTRNDCMAACDVCRAIPCTKPSTNSQSCSSEPTIVNEDITQLCKALIELIEHAQKRDKRLTAQMLVESLRGQGAQRPPHIAVPKCPVAVCEAVLLHAVLDGVLREDFHFTPYSTICYIGLGRKAALVSRGVLRIVRTVNAPCVGLSGYTALERGKSEKNVALKPGRGDSKSSQPTKNCATVETGDVSRVTKTATQSAKKQTDVKDERKLKKRKLPQMLLSDSDDEDFVHKEKLKKVSYFGQSTAGPSGVIEIDSDSG